MFGLNFKARNDCAVGINFCKKRQSKIILDWVKRSYGLALNFFNIHIKNYLELFLIALELSTNTP